MDPRRGAPLDNDLASVTVLAPTAMAADGWATALMVLGRERGAALAGSLGLRAVFVTNDGEVVASEVGLSPSSDPGRSTVPRMRDQSLFGALHGTSQGSRGKVCFGRVLPSDDALCRFRRSRPGVTG